MTPAELVRFYGLAKFKHGRRNIKLFPTCARQDVPSAGRATSPVNSSPKGINRPRCCRLKTDRAGPCVFRSDVAACAGIVERVCAGKTANPDCSNPFSRRIGVAHPRGDVALRMQWAPRVDRPKQPTLERGPTRTPVQGKVREQSTHLRLGRETMYHPQPASRPDRIENGKPSLWGNMAGTGATAPGQFIDGA